MKHLTNLFVIIATGLACNAIPTAANAEGPAVLQAVAVEVAPANVDAYLEKLKGAQAIFERLGLPAFEVWQATLAGPNTGTIVVGIEYADMAAFAAGGPKLQADPEWQKWIEEIQQAGISEVVSSSLYQSRTP